MGVFVYILALYTGILYFTLLNPYSEKFNLIIYGLWVPL